MTAPRPESTAAVIVAAGRGSRMGGEVPKQFQHLGGEPVLRRTVRTFLDHPEIGAVVVVVAAEEMMAAEALLPNGASCVAGGADRAASVTAGLAALGADTRHVLIHDGARPLVTAQVIDAVLDGLATAPAAAPALPVTDALWRGEEQVTGTVARDGLWRAQTPQGFELAAICAAHAAHPGGAADDVEVARAAGLEVAIVPGHEDNLKLTHPADRARAERILRGAMDIRIGNGFDVHRFGPGDQVVLCGASIPHERGLEGHSDADVGMHAITDAIYGALAEGDIGRHFPPSDPQWKGADSAVFLRHAAEMAREKGYKISNIDCTLICERPKVGPHATAMQATLAEITGIDADRISVKATTSERLGFTGREEGIAAMATATLVRP